MDRWKRKEAAQTMAGYVQGLALLTLAAVESVENNLSDILHNEHAVIGNIFYDVPVKEMSCKHVVQACSSRDRTGNIVW